MNKGSGYNNGTVDLTPYSSPQCDQTFLRISSMTTFQIVVKERSSKVKAAAAVRSVTSEEEKEEEKEEGYLSRNMLLYKWLRRLSFFVRERTSSPTSVAGGRR